MTVEWPTRCPYCRYLHEATTGITGAKYPSDGDVTLCINCGRLAIFSDHKADGLRKPTKRELREFYRNNVVQKLLAAYALTRRRK